jgi:hypothetical protein
MSGNWIVPSADPAGGGGVTSIIEGPNITIDPKNGLGDVTISATDPTPAITILATPPITVIENPPGTYTISLLTLLTLPIVSAPATYILGNNDPPPRSPVNFGSITGLPTVDPAKNPFITFIITLAGIGTGRGDVNEMNVGIYQDNLDSQRIVGYNSGLNTIPNLNWGSTIPAAGNFTSTAQVSLATYQAGNFNFGTFISYPNPSAVYTWANLSCQLQIYYQP